MKNWNAILIPAAALLLGACAGFYANNAYLRHRIRHFSPGGDIPAKIAERMAEKLSLDEAQHQAVYGVLKTYGERFEAQRKANREAVDAIRDEMAEALEGQLTPEQTELHRRLMEEMRAKGEKRRNLRRAMGEPPPPP